MPRSVFTASSVWATRCTVLFGRRASTSYGPVMSSCVSRGKISMPMRRSEAIALALLPHEPAAFALPGAFLFGLALVVQLLALGKRELDLGAAFFIEIELERHHRHALALDRADQ